MKNLSAKNLTAGIDQGTSGTKGVLLDENGAEVYQTVSRIDRSEKGEKKGEIVEQDPCEILGSVKTVLSDLKAKAAHESCVIRKAGLSTQRSGVLAWDKTGKNLTPLITWADQRYSGVIEGLSGSAELIRARACLPPHPGFAAPKIASLQGKFPSKDIFIGTLDAFLIYNLALPKRFVTDDSMASRTLLYNPRHHGYDDELLRIFGVDKTRLPEIVPSVGLVGEMDGIPLTAIIADQQASLVGRRSKERKSLLNLGSIFSLITDTEGKLEIKEGFSSNVLVSELDGTARKFSHTLEGTSPACSGVVAWVRDLIKAEDTATLDKIVGDSVPESEKFAVCYFPKGGTGSPAWKKEIPPVIENWDGAEKSSIARAALENVAGFVIENMEALIPDNQSALMVSGGLSKSNYLVQFIADATGKTLYRSDSPNASARGAALLAMGDSEGDFNRSLEFKMVTPKKSSALRRLSAWRELKSRCHP